MTDKESKSGEGQEIRQPIVTVAGHVDHGKTTILDSLRGSAVAEKEAGKITQKISFTKFPAKNVKKSCYLIDKKGIELKIPGFLFVDTPGHQAFTNLRKRGGSLADLAILVIDINEGIMPQTQEVLKILKQNKTPFIIALNKIDRISGWQKKDEDIKKNIEKQASHTREEFDEDLYKIIAAIQQHGFDPALFWEANFKKQVAIIPCSGETKEGLPELVMTLCGLSQKFLARQLKLSEEARGVVFEIKKEQAINYVEAILHDGKLRKGQEIAIATFDKPFLTKIRSLEEIKPISDKFSPTEQAKAATGVRMQLTETEGILPGMPFQKFDNNLEEIEKEFKQQIGEVAKTDQKGIIVKADSLGSLEALLSLLRQNNINVVKAGIGNIGKGDIISAKANQPLNSCVLGFNVGLEEDVEKGEVKIFSGQVIYKLIEELQEWRKAKQREIEREKLMKLASVFKLKILPQYVFNNSKPAIFGVAVEGGELKPNCDVISEDGESIGRIKKVQEEGENIDNAEEGQEVAISVPGITFDRQLKGKRYLYSDITADQYREFKKNKDLLSGKEKSVLKEIAKIKRKEEPVWGV